MIARGILLASFALWLSAAYAGQMAPVFSFAFEEGGEQLTSVRYSDGSTSNVTGGRGILASLGAVMDITNTVPHRFELQSTVGYKFSGSSKPGEVSWDRWPLEVMTFYHNLDHAYRLGWGVDYQFNNKLKGTEAAAPVTKTFDNSWGFVVAADYFFGPEKAMSLGLRLTRIRYAANGESRNGDSAGAGFTYVWW